MVRFYIVVCSGSLSVYIRRRLIQASKVLDDPFASNRNNNGVIEETFEGALLSQEINQVPKPTSVTTNGEMQQPIDVKKQRDKVQEEGQYVAIPSNIVDINNMRQNPQPPEYVQYQQNIPPPIENDPQDTPTYYSETENTVLPLVPLPITLEQMQQNPYNNYVVPPIYNPIMPMQQYVTTTTTVLVGGSPVYANQSIMSCSKLNKN